MLHRDRVEELKAEGWERRSIINEPRLSELAELYESMDFEVHLEPLTQDILKTLGIECKSCYIYHWDDFKIIYTRPKNQKNS